MYRLQIEMTEHIEDDDPFDSSMIPILHRHKEIQDYAP
jgi:hypothetical protein